MQLYIFIIITVLLIVKPTVNALFLSKLGADNLPYGYLLVAIVAVITSYFYNKAIRKFSLLKITIFSLVFFSLGFLALSAIMEFSILNDWLLYVYYLGVSLFAVIATSQFWILANMVFNAREAKRLFGFIGAGAITGGIFGGYLTSVVVSASSNRVVILIAAILILCCIPLIQKIWKLRILKMNVYVRNQRKQTDSIKESSSLTLISQSKHLTYLALIIGISVIVAKLVDFQFSDFANNAISDPDDLAAFFGFWFSSFNVIALCLQLFLTNRILSKLGVSSTLLILPLAIALGCLLFLTFPELWVLIIIKGIDGSFKQSLNKAAIELSIMPIPLHIKNQAKSFIDVAVDSIATGIAGFMLIFLIRRLDLDSAYITVIILLFVLVWMILIYRLREAYYNSFRANIQRTLSENASFEEKNKNETPLSTARRVLSSGNEEDILLLLDRLSTYKVKSLKYSIISLLDHPSLKVKGAAIKQFYKYDKGTALNKVEDLVSIKDDDLVYAALDYIFNHSTINEQKFFQKYLDHNNDYIANAALLCLAKEASNNKKIAVLYNLSDRIKQRIDFLNSPEGFTRREAVASLLITIAYSSMSEYYSFIHVHLNNKDQYIVKRAIKAAGITSSEQFIHPLINNLNNKPLRKKTVKALRKFGPKIIDTILALDKRQDLMDATKEYVPRIIQSFKSQKAILVLFKLLRSKDIIIRLEASKSLIRLKHKESKLFFNKRVLKKTIVRESAYYKRTLDAIASLQNAIETDMIVASDADKSTEVLIARQSLIDLLDEQLEMSLKCLFNILGLVYDETDIAMSYSGIQSDIKEARVNALEFLDNLLQSQMKTSVFPLIEHYVLEDQSNESLSVKVNVMPEKACLMMLEKNRGKRIKLEILNLIKQLDDPSYLPMVHSLKHHDNKDVKFFAHTTYEGLSKLKNVKTK